ncbi:SRR1-like protein [Wickerhamomyces ciferrii]|uniref:SRR1-like protein n=1 Tax=Wickerhamomyces ciferrii (strain ATCC 14091 / BCRC 22168 / CBS 111 / JCM 3599 / NBRC 0793 / NRRL Y-1031 F-60-10) TaxID=1206466 RepID=K0KS20_WICCF|nr:SRR1-like protein [Wickerhamomyces ciferrii]CCH45961.1 SRR1-like protein [Wickerhamomyces ciferrii]
MTEFVKVKTRRGVNGILDPEITNESNQSTLKESLEKKKQIVLESQLYEEIIQSLHPHKFTKIRCVALGSPSQEEPALYQLSLLQSLASKFNIDSKNISIYDPVFSKLDKAVFESWNYEISESYDSLNPNDVLFFLPHAPLNLTNHIISTNNPKLLLANNILTHTDRLTKSELFVKYPLLSKLSSLITINKNESNNDGFEAVVKKKTRKQKNKFIEPTIDNSKVESYFSSIDIISFKEFENGQWANSFTDLAFHSIL